MATDFDSYFPFASGDGKDSGQDRWAIMGKWWRGTGVIPAELNELEVTADAGGMYVDVNTGRVWIQGFAGILSSAKELSISAADATNPRYDRIVARLRLSEPYKIQLDVLAGTPAASPSKPALTQNSTTWEIGLAWVEVGAGVTNIAANKVTDERQFSQIQLIVNGRLSLASSTPITTADQRSKTTLYFTPYKGNLLAIPYTNGGWNLVGFNEVSLSFASADKLRVYDVFIYDNDGALTLSSTGWKQTTATNNPSSGTSVAINVPDTGEIAAGGLISVVDGSNEEICEVGSVSADTSITVKTLRASYTTPTVNFLGERDTALTEQDGFKVKSGAVNYLYLGTVITDESGQLNDAGNGGNNAEVSTLPAWRGIWNHYNRILKPFVVYDGTTSWTYDTQQWRPWNNSILNRLVFVRGIDEDPILAFMHIVMKASAGKNTAGSIALDHDDADMASPELDNSYLDRLDIPVSTYETPHNSRINTYPGLGGHFLQMAERGDNTTTNTFYGEFNDPVRSILHGQLLT